VFNNILSISRGYYEWLRSQTIRSETGKNNTDPNGRNVPNVDHTKFEAIYLASLMLDVIEEMPYADLSLKYKIERGHIEFIQREVAKYTTQVVIYCNHNGSRNLGGAIGSLNQRITFSSKSDLLELMRIPNMRKDVARILFQANILTIDTFMHIRKDTIIAMVEKSLKVIMPARDIVAIVEDLKTNARLMIRQAKEQEERDQRLLEM
jgi:replicative superfamily II helicase